MGWGHHFDQIGLDHHVVGHGVVVGIGWGPVVVVDGGWIGVDRGLGHQVGVGVAQGSFCCGVVVV